MQIRQLDPSNPRHVRQFVAFPYALYRDCALWVPPLRGEMARIMDRGRHPFYAHSEADFFVVENGRGEMLGRMAMLENRSFNAFRQRRAAFFGYFEVVEELAAARALLAAGLEWARRRGLNEVIGPRGVIGIDGSVLVEGFEHRPALGVTYNFPYYDAYIREAGFEKDADYLSGYLPGAHQLSARIGRIAARVRARSGFWVKQFGSRQEVRRWLPVALALHRRAMSQLHSYYPPTQAEVQLVLETVLTIAEPRLIKLIMKEAEAVGFILAYPDISAALQRMNGRLWPFGWLHALRERRRTSWVNVNGLGLLPEHRGLGGNAVLYTELADSIHAFGYEHVDVVQVAEHNVNSFADMESIGVRWYKRHRHYRRAV
ncbi:MAG: hypothetical protein KC425_16790 [Anaerolineales bacterium]|nr:hypothetical protein [Anaerolineales bacterium]